MYWVPGHGTGVYRIHVHRVPVYRAEGLEYPYTGHSCTEEVHGTHVYRAHRDRMCHRLSAPRSKPETRI